MRGDLDVAVREPAVQLVDAVGGICNERVEQHRDLHNFRNRYWRPALVAVGIRPRRRVYDLRHTFATFALRAGISTFELSRFMGASLTTIDRHYGHLARDGREHAIKLLDALNAPDFDPWTLVDARWTPKQPAGVTPENGSDE